MSTSLTVPSAFADYTVAYYDGKNPYQDAQSSVLTSEGQTLLSEFNAFLADVPSELKQTQDQINGLYLQFLADLTTDVRVSEAANALSPDEVTQRQVVFNVYDVLTTLLNSVTVSQIANTAVLNFLTQKQSTYADLIGNAITYIGSGTIYTKDDDRDVSSSHPKSTADSTQTQIHSSATDATKFTLGYGNISVDDISRYLVDAVSTAAKEDPQAPHQQSFTLMSDEWDASVDGYDKERNQALLSVTENSDGSFSVSATFYYQGYDDDTWESISTTTQSATASTASEAISQLNTVFLSVYALAKNSHLVEISESDLSDDEQDGSEIEKAYYIAERNIKIPWMTPTYDDDTTTYDTGGILVYDLDDSTPSESWANTLNTLRATRDQLNQTISSYVSGAEAQQQLLGDKADQQQQVIQGTTSSREMTNKILKSTIDQLSTILQSIFQH
jgi:hypothetical protein